MRSNTDVPFGQPAATQSPHSEVGFCPSSQASLMTGLMLHMAPGTLELQPKDLTPSGKEESSHSTLLSAVIHTLLSPRKHVIDVDQREHGEGADERASLDGDAAPEQGSVSGLMKQRTNHHLHIGEDAGENDPGDDL